MAREESKVTQHQNTGLLPCPFCPDSGAFLDAEYIELSGSSQQENFAECHSCGVKVYGDITQCNHDPYTQGRLNIHPSQIEEVTRKWNTRPAKAVQGDKAEALAKIDELTEDICTVVMRKNVLGIQDTRRQVRQMCLDIYAVAKSALTPESEGIAGKGDAETLLSEIWHYIVNAKLSGTTPCYDPILERMEKLRCTLTRPQEIDVEQLKREVLETVCSGVIKVGAQYARYVVSDIIDHLHSSGNLK